MTTRNKFTSLLLIALLAVLPMQIHADNPPPKQEWVVVVCAVIGVSAVVTGIYLLNKKCKPKYYWLMDHDQPPTFWVGTATKKQCQIEGWKKIGGPYNTPQDAPPTHPNPTNRVEEVAGEMQHIAVERSSDMVNWTTIHEEDSTDEDFGYFVPFENTNALFRLRITP